jgi:hypothetical protein
MVQIYNINVNSSNNNNYSTSGNERCLINLNLFKWEVTDNYGWPVSKNDLLSQMRENAINELLDQEIDYGHGQKNIIWNLSIWDKSKNSEHGWGSKSISFKYRQEYLDVDDLFKVKTSLRGAEEYIQRMLDDNSDFELPPIHQLNNNFT